MAVFYAVFAIEAPDRDTVEKRAVKVVSQLGPLERIQSKLSWDQGAADLEAAVRTQRRDW